MRGREKESSICRFTPQMSTVAGSGWKQQPTIPSEHPKRVQEIWVLDHDFNTPNQTNSSRVKGVFLARMEEHDSSRFRTKCCLFTRFMSAFPTQEQSRQPEQRKSPGGPLCGRHWEAREGTNSHTGQADIEFLALMFPCLLIFIFIEQPLPCPSQFPIFFPFFRFL